MAMEALRIAAKESKFMKFILGGFIFLAVGGLVFADVGGYFSDGVGRNEVAKVGDTVITLREFDNDLRSVLQQANLSPDEAYETGLINAYLQGRVNNILQLQAAQDLNLYLDNQAIAGQVRSMFGNMPREQIEMALRAQGLSEQAIADSIRTQMLNHYVSALPLAVANYVPDFVTQAETRYQSETRSGTIYRINLDDLADEIEISDAEIETYYDNNVDDFTIPERREFVIGTMSMDMARESLPEITEQDVRAAYESRGDEYQVAETREIAQAFVENPDDAQAIYEAAMDGAALRDALVEITGDDSGYRDLASYEAEGLPAELSDRAFDNTIKAGDVTAPVKTLLGYTVMKVTDITAPRLQSFEEVSDNLRDELQQTQVYDALYNKMIDTEDMIDSGESFDAIAEKTGLNTETTPAYTESEAVLDSGRLGELLSASPSDLEELYALPVGGVTYPYELDDENYIVIGVNNIVAAELSPLDDVRNDIEDILIQQKKENYAEDILENNIQNFQDSQIFTMADAESFEALGRDGDNDYQDIIFSMAQNENIYRIEDNEAVIITVSEISAGRTDTDSINKEDVIDQQRALLDSLLAGYYRQNVDVTINTDLLESTYSVNSIQ